MPDGYRVKTIKSPSLVNGSIIFMKLAMAMHFHSLNPIGR